LRIITACRPLNQAAENASLAFSTTC